MAAESERKGGGGNTAPHCHSDHIASFVSPTAPLLLSRSRAHPIHSPIPHKSNRSVARFDSVPFDSVGTPSVASRTESGQRSEGSGVVGCVARHGGPRRRIGVEGRRRGRRPGRGLGLAHHPADSLLRLHLPLLRSGGCFGCCDKTVRRVGELSKSLLSQDQNPTIGEEFCSTSTIEIEPADLRGVSSINTCYTSTWALGQHGPVGGSHSPPEFVNHGLFLWKQNGQEWIDNRRQQPKVKQIREPILSWNAAYQSLLGSNKPFPQPIPLHVRSKAVQFTIPCKACGIVVKHRS